MACISGSAIEQNNNEINFASGSAFQSGSSSCGSCCSVSIKVITWKECNTLTKKIGFIFGKFINFICTLISKPFDFTYKAIEFLHIDTLFNLFNEKVLKVIINKYNDFNKLVWNCIKPIFVNRATKKMADVAINISIKINDKLIKPISDFINKLFSKISKSLAPSTVKCEKKLDSIISKLYNKSINAMQFILKWTVYPINNRVITPIYNKIITPIYLGIENIFIGTVGGALEKKEKKEEVLNKKV